MSDNIVERLHHFQENLLRSTSALMTVTNLSSMKIIVAFVLAIACLSSVQGEEEKVKGKRRSSSDTSDASVHRLI